MRDMELLAMQHLRWQHAALQTRHDASRDETHHFQVGDRIWVRHERQIGNSKLVPYWLGLAVVRERLRRKTLLVSVSDTKSQEHSVSDLKPYYLALHGDSVPQYWSRQYIVRPKESPSMEYLVSKMLNHETQVCKYTRVEKLNFRVCWPGFGPKYNTWQPAEIFLPGYSLPWVRYRVDKGIAIDVKQCLRCRGH